MNLKFIWNEEESSSSGARVRPQKLNVDEVMGVISRVREEHRVSIVIVSKVVRGEVVINHAGKQGEAVVVENNIHTLAVRNPTENVINLMFSALLSRIFDKI